MFTFTRFSQRDPNWKLHRLGFSTATIGSLGCLLTDLAMVATGFGYNETPPTLAEKLKALGPDVGFTGVNVYPSALAIALTGVVFRDFLECHTTPAPMERIDAALTAGWPVIVEVDGKPAESGLQSHWVLLYGKEGSDYLMHDPWAFPIESSARTLKTSPYKTAASLEEMIQTVVLLEGPQTPVIFEKPAHTLAELENSSGTLKVYATGDFLALRSRAGISPDNLIKRVMQNTVFTVIETGPEAAAKIGNPGAWLKVIDASGDKGYVAAEFVSLTPPVVPDEAITPLPSAVQGPIVTVNVLALALRSQPVLSVETFIRYIASGTDLAVIEPVEDALKKIGVQNQWLQVRDPANSEACFVAAWLVKLHT
jgi:hypothetical protein